MGTTLKTILDFLATIFTSKVSMWALIILFGGGNVAQYLGIELPGKSEPVSIIIDPAPAIIIEPAPAIIIEPAPAIVIEPDKHSHDDKYEKKNHTHSEEFDILNELGKSHGY
jgi:hypothetical protein